MESPLPVTCQTLTAPAMRAWYDLAKAESNCPYWAWIETVPIPSSIFALFVASSTGA